MTKTLPNFSSPELKWTHNVQYIRFEQNIPLMLGNQNSIIILYNSSLSVRPKSEYIFWTVQKKVSPKKTVQIGHVFRARIVRKW